MTKLAVHNAASLTLIAVEMGVVPATRVPARLFENVSLSHQNT